MIFIDFDAKFARLNNNSPLFHEKQRKYKFSQKCLFSVFSMLLPLKRASLALKSMKITKI